MAENVDPVWVKTSAPVLDIKAQIDLEYRNKIGELEKNLQDITEERENYKNRLQAVEIELLVLKSKLPEVSLVGDSEGSNVSKLRQDNSDLRLALTKAGELLKDKSSLCQNQERQNLALTNQVTSLKEVVSITKDLLNIRNMEVQHLQEDIKSMEEKINAERKRHNAMIDKMDEAVKLNAELKTEYESQLHIFQNLKSKYEEKVVLLANENKKLEQKLSDTNSTLSDQVKCLDKENIEQTDLKSKYDENLVMLESSNKKLELKLTDTTILLQQLKHQKENDIKQTDLRDKCEMKVAELESENKNLELNLTDTDILLDQVKGLKEDTIKQIVKTKANIQRTLSDENAVESDDFLDAHEDVQN